MEFLKESMLELIIQTSTNLPPDVRKEMAVALKTENLETQAGQALAIIGENIDMPTTTRAPFARTRAS